MNRVKFGMTRAGAILAMTAAARIYLCTSPIILKEKYYQRKILSGAFGAPALKGCKHTLQRPVDAMWC